MVNDASGSSNAMLTSKRLDPTAPGIVKVGRDRADCAPRRPWKSEIPERWGQALNELDRDPVICPPSGKETRL
jgi:hypothetical protein